MLRALAIALTSVTLLALNAFHSAVYAEAAAKPKLLCDFDQQALGNGWAILGKVNAARGTPPESFSDEDGPHGSAVHLWSKGPGGIFTKPNSLSQDWRRVSEISLWVYRAPAGEKAPRVTMEVQLLEKDPRVRFWQKLDINHQGWKEYRLSLCWFLWTGGRVPQWSRVEALRLALAGEGDVWIDNIGVVEGTTERESSVNSTRLLPLAFLKTDAKQLKIKESPHVFLATDTSDLDTTALGDHLEKVVAAMQQDMPFLKDIDAQGTLLVFKEVEDYRGFLPRFAAQFGAVAVPPQRGGTGYTSHKIATSYWDAKFGSLRPVYMHEFIHSYVESALLVACTNEWFQEGLANHYQMQIHPQSTPPGMLQKAISEPKYQTPLRNLCNGKPVRLHQYWQVATVMEMLLKSPKYREAFPKLVAAIQQRGSTDLGPLLQPILNTDWDGFQRDWHAYATAAYGAAPAAAAGN